MPIGSSQEDSRIPVNEQEYWEDIFNEASVKNDTMMMELALRHLEIMPKTDDEIDNS
jgi:hypothetical protein